ncbi:MAG: hypothetical protein Q9172_002881, partial [Xanthocarpia lactea]
PAARYVSSPHLNARFNQESLYQAPWLRNKDLASLHLQRARTVSGFLWTMIIRAQPGTAMGRTSSSLDVAISTAPESSHLIKVSDGSWMKLRRDSLLDGPSNGHRRYLR